MERIEEEAKLEQVKDSIWFESKKDLYNPEKEGQ